MESKIQRKTKPFVVVLGEVQGNFRVILVESGSVWLYFMQFCCLFKLFYYISNAVFRYIMLFHLMLVLLILFFDSAFIY